MRLTILAFMLLVPTLAFAQQAAPPKLPTPEDQIKALQQQLRQATQDANDAKMLLGEMQLQGARQAGFTQQLQQQIAQDKAEIAADQKQLVQQQDKIAALQKAAGKPVVDPPPAAAPKK